MPTHSAVLDITDVVFSTDANSASFARTKVTPIDAKLTLTAASNSKKFEFIPPNPGEAQSSGIKVKDNPNGDTFDITFRLSSSLYTLVGIVNEPRPGVSNHVGREEFPNVVISRGNDLSTLTIKNRCSAPKSWEFGLVIQCVSDGTFGIHDPAIVNEPEAGG